MSLTARNKSCCWVCELDIESGALVKPITADNGVSTTTGRKKISWVHFDCISSDDIRIPICKHYNKTGDCIYQDICSFRHPINPTDTIKAKTKANAKASSNSHSNSKFNSNATDSTATELTVTEVEMELELEEGDRDRDSRRGTWQRRRVYNHGKAGALRRWLINTFGEEYLRSGSGILDIAGGKGEVSFELVNLNNISCTVIDPRPLDLERFKRKLVCGFYHKNSMLNTYNTIPYSIYCTPITPIIPIKQASKCNSVTTKPGNVNGNNDRNEHVGDSSTTPTTITTSTTTTTTTTTTTIANTQWKQSLIDKHMDNCKSPRHIRTLFEMFLSHTNPTSTTNNSKNSNFDTITDTTNKNNSQPSNQSISQSQSKLPELKYRMPKSLWNEGVYQQALKYGKTLTSDGTSSSAGDSISDDISGNVVSGTELNVDMDVDSLTNSTSANKPPTTASNTSNTTTTTTNSTNTTNTEIECYSTAIDIIQNCSILIGMHPDQATEHMVEFCLRNKKPFAVFPCCVCYKQFQQRYVYIFI